MTPARVYAGATRLLVACTVAALALVPASAGNPRRMTSTSGPVTWPGGVAYFSTDQGPLGILDNATSTQIVLDSFANWDAVPSATVIAVHQGPILLNGAPVDVDGTNWMTVLFQQDGQSPVVYDHDGSIMDALGVGGFAGVSFIEFLDPSGEHYQEMAILLDGRDIDADGAFDPTGWRSLVAHEEGHHLGLAHSVVNGQAYFFGDPILGFPSPPVTSLETMYPFLHIFDDGQAFPHQDDVGILSTLYPEPGFAPSAGTIEGTILSADIQTPLMGANVTARNPANPFDDAVASISGAFRFFSDLPFGTSGSYSLVGLTGGTSYLVSISDIFAGGFSSPVTSPLPGPDEFHNGANESNDPDRDVPFDFVPVPAPPGTPTGGIDIIINGPSSARLLDDPDALAPPDDAAVSGFAVPPEADIQRVFARFVDSDGDGGQETLLVDIDVVGPLGVQGTEFTFEMDFGETQKIRRDLLSLKDQMVEPGTRGVATADLVLSVAFGHAGPVFSGLPGLAAASSVDTTAGTVHFVAPVAEMFAQATPQQLDAANNFDGTYTLLGFSTGRLHHRLDRVPDTNDNDDPSIVQETSRYTFFPFPVVPTHLGSVPDGTLIGLEESTARTIRIGNTGFTSFSGLALSEDGRLFGSRGFGGGGGIIAIDPATASSRFIGMSGFVSVPALDFGPAGTPYAGRLYGVGAFHRDDPNYALIAIDQTTGVGTPVGGRIGLPYVDAIVFTDDGRVFATAFVNNATWLAEIDPATGAGRLIGPTGSDAVSGLEMASDGFLIGSLGGVDAQAGGLIRIDPGTGAGSFIGFTGFRPVSGLTKLP